jgi:hypothetical protein
MAQDNASLAQPLRARGADVVFAERVEHGPAREAGIGGACHQGDREPGEDQESRPLQRALRERNVRARWEELESGPVQLEE